MVADSITDSELFHGSLISIDFAKKRKANWLWKLKQWKIDARRKQWINQWEKASVGEEANGRRLQSLIDKLITDKKAWMIDYEQGRSYEFTKSDDDDDDERMSSSASSSPTSVLKSKDSVSDDCFCCSKQMTTEEEEDQDDEVFDDAFDNWDGFRDALNSFENERNESPRQEEDPNPNTSQRKKKKKPSNLANLFHHKDNPKASPEKKIPKTSRKKKRSSNTENQEGDEKRECPICSEVMDATDLSFQPCPCGFRLCLFCHKKISENDARCPACRNKYDQTSTNNSGQVTFQQRGRGTLRLSPSFRGLDRA